MSNAAGASCCPEAAMAVHWSQAHTDAAVTVAVCAALGFLGAIIGALADRRRRA